MMKAKVYVTLKPGLLDVQGKTVKSALESLGFDGLSDVRVGKYIEIDSNGADKAAFEKDVEQMCEKLLINPVIEVSKVEIQ